MNPSRRGLLGLFALAPIAAPALAKAAMTPSPTLEAVASEAYASAKLMVDARGYITGITMLGARTPEGVAFILTEQSARACGDSSLAHRLTNLDASADPLIYRVS